jgi:tight adherence protein B
MDKKEYFGKYKEGKSSRFSPGLKNIGISIVQTVLVTWIVYNNFGGAILFPVFFGINVVCRKMAEKEAFNKKFREEYKEFLNGIAALLSGGLSIEQAFLEEERELKLQYGDDSYMLNAIHKINAEVCLNRPIEESFMDFSHAIDLNEVSEFAEIFIYAKRMGGDYIRNIRHTADKIGENIELQMDIDIITAEKRLEMKVMSIMPVFIIVYIRLTASGFIAPMYESIGGRIVMTLCLMVYGLCLMLGKKITEKV